ncbi:MAG TPA: alpha/beta hydrolase [Rhizomicrobium sp.]|nr:alpha/beta hydrolase [Rhizomicrobium sp.]
MADPFFIETPDGRRLRAAVFGAPAAARRVCVLAHGQTEFIEKYVEVIGELNARGFTVATFDWPGQGGSCRLLGNPLKAHIEDFRQYDQAIETFLDRVVKPISPGPPIALAHSMGGHNLLRLMHGRPNAIAAAVLTAPMLRAGTRGVPRWIAMSALRLENLFGNGEAWIWGMDKRDPLTMDFDAQLVTSDKARFARTRDIIAAHPDLRLAGPTWHWLEAANASMAEVMAPGYAQAIVTPTLIVGAGKDRIVETSAAREFARRLPHGRYLELADAEHEILMENDSIRSRFWKAFDDFVDPLAQ